jgi:endonuclease/exonuclease/phosphatase family metal-dependent hydrolase
MRATALSILFFTGSLLLFLQSCRSTTDDKTKDQITKGDRSLDLRDAQIQPEGYDYSEQHTFKVLSWNVEHFVDGYDDPYIDASRENNPESKLREKLAYFVEGLNNANADIVILQEFESSKYLRQIAKDSLSHLGYTYFASAPSDDWYMNVVVMSKFPLGVLYAYGNVTTPALNCVNEDGVKETQNHLNTRMWSLEVFPSEDYNFILTGLHLKAGRGERNEALRLGQINFLKQQFQRFIKIDPSQNLLITGDLNSTLESNEIKALKQGTHEADTFIDPLPKAVMTHPSDEPERRLDYALFNGNMQNEYVANSAKVPDLLDPEKLVVLSDHLPVMISFKTRDE